MRVLVGGRTGWLGGAVWLFGSLPVGTEFFFIKIGDGRTRARLCRDPNGESGGGLGVHSAARARAHTFWACRRSGGGGVATDG